MRSRLAVGLIAICSISVTACGVPTDDGPRDLDPGAVPFDLSEPPTTSTTEAGVALVSIEVFFVRGERLVAARRSVEAPPTAVRRVEAVLGGPVEAEATTGVRTAISGATALIGVDFAAGTVTLDLSAGFAEVTGPEQILAIAQLVFTATAADGAERVAFSLQGSPVEVPRGDGTLTATPLQRSDFGALAPP